MDTRVQILIKFGEQPHISSLYEKGEIYLNPLEYFKKPIPHGRFDTSEGRSSLQKLESPYLELKVNPDDNWKKLKILNAQLNTFLNAKTIKVYSLYYIAESDTRRATPFELSDEIKNMGEYFLLINNPNVFLRRLESRLIQMEHKFEFGFTNYYLPHINQTSLGYFDKPQQYKYQSEFRIIVESDIPGPLKFEIGSLADIAEVIETKLCKGFNFCWK